MEQLTSFLTALSDPSRLRIVGLLLQADELCVCDIQAALTFTQTKVSRHMRYLRERGIVRIRKSGRWAFYSISPEARRRCGGLLKGIGRELASLDRASADRRALAGLIRDGCCAAIEWNASTGNAANSTKGETP